MIIYKALASARQFLLRHKADIVLVLAASGVLISKATAQDRNIQTVAIIVAGVIGVIIAIQVFFSILCWLFWKWNSVEVKKRLQQSRFVAAVFGLAPFFIDRSMTLAGVLIYTICAIAWPMAIAVAFNIKYPKTIRRFHAITSPQVAPLIPHSLAVLAAATSFIAWSEGVRLIAAPRATLTTTDNMTMIACLVGALAIILIPTIHLLFWEPTDKREVGHIVQSSRDGLPRLEWSQLAGGLVSEAHDDSRGRLMGYLGVVIIGTIAGLATGSLENMVLGTLLAAWLGAFGLRGAGSLVMHGETLKAVPHQITRSERAQEMTPLTERQDCAAYLEVQNADLMFVVEQGDRDAGTMQIVERVPFNSFLNFEEGSHHEWFKSRISTSEVRDWGVIIAQSSIGRVVLVAQSVNDKAWLIELLSRLQTTFIEQREAMLQAVAAASAGKPSGSRVAGASGNDGVIEHSAPTRRF